MKKTRLTFSMVGLCLVLLTVAGCGGGDGGGSSVPPQDTTPNAFNFTSPSGVPLDTVITSDSVTITGISSDAPISIDNGTYSINGMDFSTTAGPVRNGQTVAVRHTSASTVSTPTVTTLTIGGRSSTFTSTTVAVDLVPDAFIFTSQSGVAPSTLVTSNTITVAGLTSTAAISVSGGQYSINGGAYTAAAGTVANTDTVSLQHTSSASYGAATVTTLTIGTAAGTFTSTTLRDGPGVYDTFCAVCHTMRLNDYDTLPVNDGAGDLSGFGDTILDPLSGYFVPGQPSHQGITLTAGEIANLAEFIDTGNPIAPIP